MRNRIWNEMVQAKFNELYACRLISRANNITNRYKIFIIIFSTTGIFGWKIFSAYSSIVCGALAVTALIEKLKFSIVPTTDKISKLNKIAEFYNGHFRSIEALWHDYLREELNDKAALTKLHKIEETEKKINKVVNDIHSKTNKTAHKVAFKETQDFFESNFNYIP